MHSYIDIAASTSDRQEKLQVDGLHVCWILRRIGPLCRSIGPLLQVLYGFECTCALCGKGDDPLLVARADGMTHVVGLEVGVAC